MGRARKDLRDGPITTGRPSSANSSQRASTSKLWVASFAKPRPGIDQHRVGGQPGANGERHALAQLVAHLVHDVVVRGLLVHVVRTARACASG